MRVPPDTVVEPEKPVIPMLTVTAAPLTVSEPAVPATVVPVFNEKELLRKSAVPPAVMDSEPAHVLAEEDEPPSTNGPPPTVTELPLFTTSLMFTVLVVLVDLLRPPVPDMVSEPVPDRVLAAVTPRALPPLWVHEPDTDVMSPPLHVTAL